MSSSTFINPFLYVECASVEQADDLESCLQLEQERALRIEDEDDTDPAPILSFDFLRGGPANSTRIQILLQDGGDCESFDNDIVQLNQRLQAVYKLRIQGYWIAEVDGMRYRGELNAEGSVRYTDVDWLLHYSCDRIDGLRKLAEWWEENNEAE